MAHVPSNSSCMVFVPLLSCSLPYMFSFNAWFGFPLVVLPLPDTCGLFG